ncbi:MULTISPECIES: type II secretion system protein GspG [Acinetobacter]|uniref:type II secretion system protein GspG n=1 Tax=Acinetobacter TaxID=469 RepID=UPI00192BC834|nr:MULTISPECIES: type II secretion system protein GspG [Acinetobacter]
MVDINVNERSNKLGVFPYVIAAMSFIPGIGVIFGVIAVIWGVLTKKSGGKVLTIIGAFGIGLSIVLYGSLFYFGFVQRGGLYDELRAQSSQIAMTSLVQAIEFYKVENGHYPDSLEILNQSLPENSSVFVFDATDVSWSSSPRYYHYELKDSSHYYLLSVGQDGEPYTSDDILPNIELKPDSKIGLIFHDSSTGSTL